MESLIQVGIWFGLMFFIGALLGDNVPKGTAGIVLGLFTGMGLVWVTNEIMKLMGYA